MADHHVLYELHVPYDWVEQIVQEAAQERTLTVKDYYQFLSTALKNLTISTASKDKRALLGSHIAISDCGGLVAVLKDTTLEIRVNNDELEEVYVQNVKKDVLPQYRKLQWSQNYSGGKKHLVYCSSYCEITIFDQHGRLIKQLQETSRGIGSLVLFNPAPSNVKSLRLITVDNFGSLRSHSLNTTAQVFPQYNHCFQLPTPFGVGEVVRIQSSNLLLVPTTLDQGVTHISLWRILDSEPWYSQLSVISDITSNVSSLSKVTNRLLGSAQCQSVVRVEPSLEGQVAVLSHGTGTVMVRQLPSLSVTREWTTAELSSVIGEGTVTDIGWWNISSLCLLTSTGTFIVIPTEGPPSSLLGVPEQFERESLLPASYPDTTYILECEKCYGETQLTGQVAIYSELFRTLRNLLTWMTDWEPAPPTTLLSLTYRVCRLNETTPEGLFNKKIQSKEYGEALKLAERFSLDKNEVYKTQWLKSCFNRAAVQDFLSRITESEWVIEQIDCCIPDKFDTAKVLLDLGLVTTQQILRPNEGLEGEDEEAMEVDLDSKWQEIRCWLLYCKDNLMLYETILGPKLDDLFDGSLFKRMCGQSMVKSALHFAYQGNWEAVDHFMTKVRPAVKHHWLLLLASFPETLSPAVYADLLPELVITDTPARLSYRGSAAQSLRSLIQWVEGTADVGLWDEEPLRATDWAEEEDKLYMFRPPSDVAVPSLYTELTGPLTAQNVFKWYTKRSEEMEVLSSLADHAMILLDAGVQRGVPLDIYCVNMRLLIDAVYKIGRVEVGISNILDQPINHLIDFILAKSSQSFIINDLINYAVPYISKLCNLIKMEGVTVNALLRQFILEQAKQDLTPLHLALKQSFEVSEESPLALIPFCDRVPLVVECFKVCRSPQGWAQITDLILPLFTGKHTPRYAVDLVYLAKQVSLHVEDTSLHDVYQTSQYYEQSLAMLEKLFKKAGSGSTTADQLLDLVLEVGEVCGTVLFNVTSQHIYTIFARAMLGSGVRANIMLTNKIKSHVPYDDWSAMLEVACKQYIDCSVDIEDPNIAHARSILEVAGRSTLSKEEQHLATLTHLAELGLRVPPLKLRDKVYHTLWLEEAVCASPSNYLKEKELVKLANMLGLKNKSYVQELIAGAAFTESNFSVAKTACDQAITAGSKDIWGMCLALGQCKNYLNRGARREMIEFSLRHCPSNQVDDLMVLHEELSEPETVQSPAPTPASSPPFYPHYILGQDMGAYTLAEIQHLSTDLSDSALCCAAKETLYRDSWLTAVLLLQLQEPGPLLTLQSSLPADDLYSAHLCLVVAALRITGTPLHRIGSLQQVIQSALEAKDHQWSPVLQSTAQRIGDTLQGRVLKEVNSSINVPRFTHDVKYRRQSILGLAMSHDLHLPLSLADRYSMDRWEVYFAHFKGLLSDPTIPEINSLAQALSHHLLAKSTEFIARSKTEIYPDIAGTNHVQLACYYGMLRSAGCTDSEQHSRVLKKLRAAVPGLDYKQLTSSASPLAVLSPLLTSSNVHVVAKNSSFLNLSSSFLFLAHFTKLFWEGEGKSELSYDVKWDRISKDIGQLTKEDRKKMVLHFTLDPAPEGRAPVPLTTKLTIASGMSTLTAHLHTLDCPLFTENDSFVYHSYSATEGSQQIVEDIAKAMFLSKDHYQDLSPFLNTINTPLTSTRVLESSVTFIIERLLRVVAETPLVTVVTPSGHVCAIPCYDMLYWYHKVPGEELLTNMLYNLRQDTQPALALLRPFCSDLSLPFEARSKVMTIIEAECELSTVDTALITFYKTSALLIWSKEPLTLAHIESPLACSKLCYTVCGECQNEAQCTSVSTVMLMLGVTEEQCVKDLMSAAARTSTTESSVIEMFKLHHHSLTEEETSRCSTLFPPPLSHKLLLLSEHLGLYYDVIDTLCEHSEQIDSELCSLLCLRELLPHLINTGVYPHLIRYVLTQDRECIKKCVRELKEAGCNVEAASLTAQALPSAYTTINSALALMKRWTA